MQRAQIFITKKCMVSWAQFMVITKTIMLSKEGQIFAPEYHLISANIASIIVLQKIIKILETTLKTTYNL